MKKIPTLFVRDPDDRRHVTDEVTPGCEWVLAGEGVATRKYDGTCVMLDDSNRWWARREVGSGKREPENFQPEQRDNVTRKVVGWEPMAQSPFARFHAEALTAEDRYLTPGTYELIGPKINGNPERVERHQLVRHATAERVTPRVSSGQHALSPEAMVRHLGQRGWEGLVWHHPDGRMAKLKARDLR